METKIPQLQFTFCRCVKKIPCFFTFFVSVTSTPLKKLHASTLQLQARVDALGR